MSKSKKKTSKQTKKVSKKKSNSRKISRPVVSQKEEEFKVKPIGDRILIKEFKEELTTASGIILPDSLNNEEEMKKGTVIEVGSGKLVNGRFVSVGVKRGDKVLFKKWADKVKIDKEEYYLANESDLVAIIKN